MNMVSAGGFSGVSFHLRRCPQRVAAILGKKTPIFGSRRSKLDNLTVHLDIKHTRSDETKGKSRLFIQYYLNDYDQAPILTNKPRLNGSSILQPA
jgi:hypothetical protein